MTSITKLTKITLPFISMLGLSACSPAMTQSINTAINDINKNVNALLSTPSTQQSKSSGNAYPKSDLVQMFGWMEDGCQGDTPPYDSIRQRYGVLTDLFFQESSSRPYLNGQGFTSEFKIPKSQWSDSIKQSVNNITVSSDGERYTYTMHFVSGSTYRGQPLTSFTFDFKPETDDVVYHIMDFATNADLRQVVKHFYGKEVEDFDGSFYKSVAKYDPSKKAIICQG